MARAPRSLGYELFCLLWQPPLFAVPFALFFGTLFGGGAASYVPAYLSSLVFSYLISIAIFLVRRLAVPRLEGIQGPSGYVVITATYMGASVLASFVAAAILHATLIPGMLGSPRQAVVVGMFTVLFGALAMGISFTIAFHKQSLERARAEQELVLARRIQSSFLLSSFPARPRLEVHAENVASRHVSGDFYDVVPAGDDAVFLAIADVAGKGVPAALLSSMLQASLRTLANTTTSVGAILAHINQVVHRSAAVHQFATFFLARVDERTLRLTFSNAGHNFPVLFRKRGGRTTLEKGGTVVGILDSMTYEEDSVTLEPGDRVVLYSDGITEASRDGVELFGEERLEQLVESLPPDLSARDITARILDGVRRFLAGVEPGDDMTVLVLRVLEPAPVPAGAAGSAPVAAARPPA